MSSDACQPWLQGLVQKARGLLDRVHLVHREGHVRQILKGVSGRLQPRRMALLLGPPGHGRSVLLRALSGMHQDGLQVLSALHRATGPTLPDMQLT